MYFMEKALVVDEDIRSQPVIGGKLFSRFADIAVNI